MPQIGSPLGSTAVQLLVPTNATAETTTVAGVDLKDFIDDILIVLSSKRPNASAGATLNVTFNVAPADAFGRFEERMIRTSSMKSFRSTPATVVVSAVMAVGVTNWTAAHPRGEAA